MTIQWNKIGALFRKDLKDTIKNNQFLLLALLPILFTTLYRFLSFDNGVTLDHSFVLTMGLLMNISMQPLSVMSMMIAEEKEKNTLRTLMLSNVTAATFLVSKTLVIFLLVQLVNLVIYFIAGVGLITFGWFLLITSFSLLCMILFGAVIGIMSKNQMATGMYTAPAMLLFLMPAIFAQISEAIANIAQFSPTYAMMQLLLTNERTGFYIAVLLVWTVLATALFGLIYQKKRLD